MRLFNLPTNLMTIGRSGEDSGDMRSRVSSLSRCVATVGDDRNQWATVNPDSRWLWRGGRPHSHYRHALRDILAPARRKRPGGPQHGAAVAPSAQPFAPHEMKRATELAVRVSSAGFEFDCGHRLYLL
jgi:hypothetical protein